MAYITGGGPSKAAAPTVAPKPAGPKVTYVVSQPQAAAAAAGGVGGAAPGGLAGQASARAAADTAALVAGLQAQQQAAYQQAALRAAQQGALGLGASKYLEGLHIPERTASDFSNAAAAQVAAAQGFQGGLQQTVGDAAQAVQANLAAMGGTQTASNQSQAAGNALYALGGYLPSAQLGVVGPALAAGQRALPAQTLGFGQMLAMGELGAGQQEAAKITPEIVSAYAKQGPLAATYLDALNEAAAAAAKARQDAAFKQATLEQNAAIAQSRVDIANQKASAPHFFSAGGVGYAWDPNTGNVRQVTKDAPATAASLPHYKQFGDTLYEVTPAGLSPVATKPAAAPHLTTISDATGTYVWDPATGARGAKVAGPPASATPTPSVAAGTAIARLDPARTNINGVKSDQYGNWINYGTKAKPRYSLATGWRWDKTGTPVKIVKPGGAGSYKIPAGVYSGAQKVVEVASGVSTTIGTGAFASTTPAGKRQPYAVAHKRVVAYLNGALPVSGIPGRAKIIEQAAEGLLVSNGYKTPLSTWQTAVEKAPTALPGQAFGVGQPVAQNPLLPTYTFGP